jgi:50S ribosomal protein L16 3-hydroxylase
MSTSLAALDALPSIVDFYAHYWNKRPFLVRDAIDQTVMDGLITPDELAGLSMEETARAKISTPPESHLGACSSKTSNNFTQTPPRYCARSTLRPVG